MKRIRSCFLKIKLEKFRFQLRKESENPFLLFENDLKIKKEENDQSICLKAHNSLLKVQFKNFFLKETPFSLSF